MILWDLFVTSTAQAATFGLKDSPNLGSGDPNTQVAQFLNRIAELMFVFAIPLAIVGIVYAAIALLRAAGKPDGYAAVKKILISIFIGIFLIVFAAVLVRLAGSVFRRTLS